MRMKNNKGITLIALVITIIVLLILAGVTISMVLGDDGIIAQAQEAKKQNEESSLKDATEIAKGEATLAQYVEQTPMNINDLNTALEKTGDEVITNNTTVAKVVDRVPIPIGFAYVEGTKKDTGLIIVDGSGNEFVWVPVENAIYNSSTNPTGMFTKTGTGVDTVYTGKLYDWKNATVDESGNWTVSMSTSYAEPKVLTNSSYDENGDNKNAIWDDDKYPNGLSEQFQEEYNAMAKSVETYGGFYVGRYETSWTGSKVASVQGATPTKEDGKNEIFKASTDLGPSWDTSRSDNKAAWYGLYKYQKELYNKDTDSVVSGMIYGAQYDAIMNWMKDIPNNDPSITDEAKKFYIKNSTGMGVYIGDGGPLVTGQHKVNNIYDLAGNYWEWTQEAYNANSRVGRGGYYDNLGSSDPASSRNSDYPANASKNYSSRLQIYIK